MFFQVLLSPGGLNVKGRINIYDNSGNLVYTLQGLINIKHEGGITAITYQDDSNQTRTIQTNMQYIYWQD